jgi:hypothetical protein
VTGAALRALWLAAAAGGTRVPVPELAAADWDAVARGTVTSKIVDEGGMRRVVALGLLPVPRERAWLSITDDHLSEGVGGLTEVVLEGAWAGEKALYQRLDLPWPFADRHWVIRLHNRAAGGLWERAWDTENTLLPTARSRTDAVAFEAAEPVADNRGSWLLALAGDATLAVYQARADLGGNVPSAAVDAYTRSSVSGLYASVTTNAGRVVARYGPGCAPQPGADGAPIPCVSAPP